MKIYPLAMVGGCMSGPAVTQPDPDEWAALELLYNDLAARVPIRSRILSMQIRVVEGLPPGVVTLEIKWPDDLTAAERAAADALVAAHAPS